VRNNKLFIPLKHKSLNVYQAVREITTEIYKITLLLPAEERFNIIQQIRRATLSVIPNLAKGCSRRSLTERKRYYEVSRGSIVEIDAILETAVDMQYLKEDGKKIGDLLNKCFAMLSNMIG